MCFISLYKPVSELLFILLADVHTKNPVGNGDSPLCDKKC